MPLLEAGKELGVEGKAARKLAARLEAAEEAVARHPLAAVADLRQRLAALQSKQALEQVGGSVAPGCLLLAAPRRVSGDRRNTPHYSQMSGPNRAQ